MLLRKIIVCCILLTARSFTKGNAEAYYFDLNARCQQAYSQYLALRPAAGDALIREEFLANPYNLAPTFIADYGDFLTLLFNGDPTELHNREDRQDLRLELLGRAPDHEPWKQLSEAGVYLHWAIIRARNGEQIRAALAFRKSFALLRDNAARFPRFSPNEVFLGAEEAVAGTVPEDYSWLASLLGMKGSVTGGEKKLADYLAVTTAANTPLREEALIYLLYLRLYLLSKSDAVWSYVGNEATYPAKGNLMRLFVRGNIALNSRRADAAAAAFRSAQSVNGSSSYPAFDYELGNALFLKLDDDCITYFERFVKRNSGKLFTKDALQKIALARYLQHKPAEAGAARARILNNGNASTDADKTAQRFAKTDAWPNALLLQARLLTDGGFWQPAAQRLQSADLRLLNDPAFALEYYFRLGRTQDDGGDVASAVQSYQRAINLGRERSEQFAARSALMMALIYERGGQKKEALQYFRLALSMRHHDFQSSIDQQSKAGINRN